MEVTTLVRTVGLDLLKPALPQRQLDGHKGTFGKLLIVGGAVGYTGAPYLTASAAARTGCGLVSLGVPKTIWPIEAAKCVSAMPFPLPEKNGMLAGKALPQILEKLDGCDVLALGPGLGRSRETARLVWELLKTEKPLVLDADVAGLGVLFIGMEMMGSAMEPLREWPAFVNLVSTFSNPVVGILAGAAFTALIQSSSASVGILQALALSGVIGLDSAVYVLFGQNIGTCITAVLASIGTSRNAKRTTIIHLMFNVFGTVLFTVICMATPLTGFMQSMTPDNPAAQIANMHTLFNIVTTLLLLPFGGYLVKIAMRILPDRKEDKEEGMHLAFLVPMPASKQEHPIGFSAMYVTQIRQELNRMMGMAKENIATSFQAVLERDVKRVESAEATEEYIDYLNKEISQYISNIIVHETNEKDSTAISAYFKITGNIERIGDHAMNICEYTQMLDKKKIQFSEEAQEELRTMEAVCLEVLDLLEQESIEPTDWLTKVSALEQRMDDMTEEYRRNQMKRMKQGSCSDEACIIFSELLTDFERIGDHALNIAQERAGIATEATDA